MISSIPPSKDSTETLEGFLVIVGALEALEAFREPEVTRDEDREEEEAEEEEEESRRA